MALKPKIEEPVAEKNEPECPKCGKRYLSLNEMEREDRCK